MKYNLNFLGNVTCAKPDCLPNCGNGNCVNGLCQCNLGWTGANCNQKGQGPL